MSANSIVAGSRSRAARWSLRGSWVLANAIAAVVSASAGAALSELSGMAFFVLLGVLFLGPACGLAQGLALRHYMSYQDWSEWAFVSVWGTGFGWFLGVCGLASLLSEPFHRGSLNLLVLLLAGGAIGIILSAFQCIVLLQHLRDMLSVPRAAGAWIVANAIGWASGMVVLDVVLQAAVAFHIGGPPILFSDDSLEEMLGLGQEFPLGVILVVVIAATLAAVVGSIIPGWTLERILKGARPPEIARSGSVPSVSGDTL